MLPGEIIVTLWNFLLWHCGEKKNRMEEKEKLFKDFFGGVFFKIKLNLK